MGFKTKKAATVVPISIKPDLPTETFDSWLHDLISMLSYKRPYNSKTEFDWVAKFLEPLGGEYDDFGNYIVVVGEGSRTMFSAHTDTVHRKEGKQTVCYDAAKGWIYKKDGECLGADDAAGVWLLTKMIQFNVPGTYVFHRGEERGGKGSSWIATHRVKWLTQFDRAVAFDRKALTSVITHQGERCCSDEFGNALAAALGGDYKLDPTGVFTDTANYVYEVPECTNLSCGYYDEHTAAELLDVHHLFWLAQRLINVDWESLPVARDPKVPDPEDAWSKYTYGNWTSKWLEDDLYKVPAKDDLAYQRALYKGMTEEEWEYEYGDPFELHSNGVHDFATPASSINEEPREPDWRDFEDIFDWTLENPETAAYMLYKYKNQSY